MNFSIPYYVELPKNKKKERGRHENFWPVISRHVAYVAAPKLEGEIGRHNVTTERKLN